MSAMYSTIAFAASVAAGSQGASYELRRESKALQIFGAFNALGTVMFAFGGHAILLEVQVSSCLTSWHFSNSCLPVVSAGLAMSRCLHVDGPGEIDVGTKCVLEDCRPLFGNTIMAAILCSAVLRKKSRA